MGLGLLLFLSHNLTITISKNENKANYHIIRKMEDKTSKIVSGQSLTKRRLKMRQIFIKNSSNWSLNTSWFFLLDYE